MKLNKYSLLAIIILALSGLTTQAKPIIAPKAYMFGFIANFTDSIVYFTDIQTVDSVWYDQKTEFLEERSNYANQLRNYFTNHLNMPHRTCVVVFALTRKDIEKKYMKLKKQYTVKHVGKYDVKYLNENEFQFTPIEIDSADNERSAEQPKKEEKEKVKRNMRDGKRPPRRNK